MKTVDRTVMPTTGSAKVAVVIPCYRVRDKIMGVLHSLPDFLSEVYVVDDACPQQSGHLVETECKDPRVRVLRMGCNRGVGGAVMTGYQAALEAGAEVVVKLDGDGQMDPNQMWDLVVPILRGEADYTKGNRFYDLTCISSMPAVRIVGNATLSLMAKLSTGYWDLFDPTNGYTAICSEVLTRIPLSKVSNRYFFETDLLFRLNILRAVVRDVPMDARYGDEISSLSIGRVVGEFAYKHMRNTCKRIFYNYFLRDFTIASLQLVVGGVLMLTGLGFGLGGWWQSYQTGIAQSAGTVMLAALPIVLGLQLVLAFLAYDMSNLPRTVRR